MSVLRISLSDLFVIDRLLLDEPIDLYAYFCCQFKKIFQSFDKYCLVEDNTRMWDFHTVLCYLQIRWLFVNVTDI